MSDETPPRRWTFLTSHAHVLLCIANNPDARIRDIAEQVGITERATHRIIGDLDQEGYVSTKRVGRRNSYTVNPELEMRHPLIRSHHIGELLEILKRPSDTDPES